MQNDSLKLSNVKKTSDVSIDLRTVDLVAAITTSVNPDTGKVVYQSMLSTEAAHTAGELLSNVTRAAMLPAYYDELSPGDAKVEQSRRTDKKMKNAVYS